MKFDRKWYVALLLSLPCSREFENVDSLFLTQTNTKTIHSQLDCGALLLSRNRFIREQAR